MTRTHYVAGFMFDHDCTHVALIEKKRPAWQAGKLNAIGGHIEPEELAHAAMSREFREETGMDTAESRWLNYATLSGTEYLVEFFAAIGDVRDLKSTTDEQVTVYGIECVNDENAISNLTFLIPMALLALKVNSTKLIITEV